MKQYSVYIFDLDGTLTDSASVWLGIFRDGLTALGITPPADDIIAHHTHVWSEVLKLGVPEDKLDDFIAFAHQAANERLPKASMHTGALDMLQKLKTDGKRIAIFSTMDRKIFEPAVKSQKLAAFAEVMTAGDDVEFRKPHPAGILKTLEDLGVPKSAYDTTVYIGDKDTDVLAAHNAGIDGILYYPPAHQEIYSRQTIEACKPTAIIEHWEELFS